MGSCWVKISFTLLTAPEVKLIIRYFLLSYCAPMEARFPRTHARHLFIVTQHCRRFNEDVEDPQSRSNESRLVNPSRFLQNDLMMSFRAQRGICLRLAALKQEQI